jgi:hypothetical protein
MKLTRKKLIWFGQMWEAIEERATLVTDYVGRVKIPSVHKEHLSSIEVGNEYFRGETVVKRYVRGENNYLTFPTQALYDDEYLVRYRQDKEDVERRRETQYIEEQTQEALRTLHNLEEKYPQFFSPVKFKGEKNG